MPSLRLTDEEAADVAAYLVLAEESGVGKEAASRKSMRQRSTMSRSSSCGTNSTDIEAREKLKGMTPIRRICMPANDLISRYGCFGCHNIPGFENAQPIGTELTEAGSKLISQLDFGFLPIEHSRRGWYEQKLKDPRIFDVGPRETAGRTV